MQLYDVPASDYREVLDAEFPDDVADDTVAVDRRGYAPDVADELGDDYLDGQILLFGDQQQYADLRHEDFSFTDDMVGWTYGHPFLAEYANEQPVRLDIDVLPMPDRFYVQASIASEAAKDHFAEAQDAQRRINSLTADDLLNKTEDNYIEDLADQADTALDRFGGLEDLDFDTTVVQDAVPSFTFTLQDTDGYMFTTAQNGTNPLYSGFAEEPYAIFIGDTSEDLFDFPYTAVDATEQVDDVIQALYATAEIEVDMDSATDRMDDLMRNTAGTDETDDTEFYLSKEFKETGQQADDLPDEYWILQDLTDGGDITITDPADLAKLPHFTGETPAATALLSELQEMEDDAFRFPDDEPSKTSTTRTRSDEIRDVSDFISEYMETDSSYNSDGPSGLF